MRKIEIVCFKKLGKVHPMYINTKFEAILCSSLREVKKVHDNDTDTW